MARSVYLTSVGSGGGKSTIALGLAELLSRQVGRIGVFRPLVADTGPDPILALLSERYRVELPLAELAGATYAEATALVADGRRAELISAIVERYRAVERQCPAVVVVGSDFDEPGDPAHPRELAFNARLATEFGSVVVPVVDGFGQEPGAVAAAVRGAYHDLADLGATVLAVIANRVPGPMTLPDLPVPAYAIPEVPSVSAPTVAEVAAALGATLLAGDEAALGRDVLDFVVGAAHVPTLLSHLTEGALVITPGDRADLLVAASAAHVAGQVSVAGLVLTLGEQPDPRVMRLVEGLNTGLAVLSVRTDSYDTVAASSRIEGRPSAANPRKVEAALGAFERCVDTDDLARRLRVSRSTRVTPLMFENELIDRARSKPRHLVLPEGSEERILRASEILLRRGVAELTLLGRPDDIARRTRELGIDLGDANVVDPVTSGWRDDFAAEYARLRAHRGVTAELAHDIVAQANYFGTLMVATGRADGMVSGATHTTAATIRPAFEIIRTVPDVSVASSVFFMLLADRVLVYGDCAVNRDPDAAQLADIAISSADTAARFGIEPRVAMLSYSTGSSGAGADVEKVATATALVRERRPDLLVEGPIQYDAAIDPAVAATKLPGSAVAGQATVFIFPDLNTGNNTYKAVQRSAGAVAVGPVMQGLRRPVNDLSRGATVPDIVNTVAITAIQAATEEAS
ncbi:phosphate acetyltransferase [Micromonospora parathelypteridis]|uniref:Phosphate acetyltransferase n=1 Tax=Micromonospora parathelypteridis TaxID=1839617 RepID=A0A840VKZ4_9ACTN|nr:phosphate acetyltransferase [Micromonospora parathelypteridis]MBB5477325.1 phosphate acetyltransferase [Micromonospora parathelypteridis]GGO09362.1 phosphate acetyltransferase [Micromonospora parathelypteridis]